MNQNEMQYEKMCCYCRNARAVKQMESYICGRKKVVPYDGTCRKFSFDPLKITQHITPSLDKYEKEDFEI